MKEGKSLAQTGGTVMEPQKSALCCAPQFEYQFGQVQVVFQPHLPCFPELFGAQWMVQLRIHVDKHTMKYEFLPTADHR